MENTARHPTIIQIAPGEVFGGVERHLLGLCAKLSIRGHMVKLILFHQAELAEQASASGLEVVVLPDRATLDFRSAFDLAAQIRLLGGDLLHVHGYRAMVTVRITKLMGRVALPVVKTEHGLSEPTGARLVEGLKSRIYSALDDSATRSTASSVCYVSADLQRAKSSSHSTVAGAVIGNGIDPIESLGQARPLDLPNAGLCLGIIGRLTEVKGVIHAIDALSRSAMPEDAQIIVLGDGPLRRELEEHAAAIGVSKRVTFLGFRRNVFDYLAHFDALLMPSLHEGLPYTLLEAMSLGCPVLASRVGGLAEVLIHDQTGLLFEAGDPGAIAAAVERLASEVGLAERLGTNAATIQRRSHSLDGMVDEYIGIYESVLDQSKKRMSRN